MSRFLASRPLRAWACAALSLALLASAGNLRPLAAAETGGSPNGGSALKFIPADAAMFSSTLRLKEQLDLVAQSKAWAKLKAMPAVQSMVQQAQAKFQEGGGGREFDMMLGLLKLPENQQLIELLGDMAANEAFVYADQSAVGFTDLSMQLVSAMRYGPSLGAAAGGDQQTLVGRAVMSTLAKNLQLVQVPTIIVGFKLSKREPAETQLKRLEVLAELMLKQQAPELAARLKREKVDGVEYLTFAVDGQMVPWDQVQKHVDQLEQQPGEFAKVMEKLKSQKLAVALGVREDYLLLSIGGSYNALAGLGKGKMLADRPELKPFAPFAQQRVTGVAYTSQAFMQKLSNPKRDIDDAAKAMVGLLENLPLDAAMSKRIAGDIQTLATDIKSQIPDPTAITAFSLLTPTGFEFYTYQWGPSRQLDGSKRLDLLEHVGGSPLAALVNREKTSREQYNLLVKWTKIAYQYFEDYGVPTMTPKDQGEFNRFANKLLPLVARFDQVTSTELLPSLSDGQSAFVLEGRNSSKQWLKAMPPSDAPLNLLEPALVFGVSDPDLLKKACGNYWTLANDTVEAIRDLAPKGQIPAEFKLAPPTVRKLDGGDLYQFAFPGNLDPQLGHNGVALTAGLSGKVAVLSLTPKTADRLLTATPLSATGPLADAKQPLAAAGYLNWAALLDATAPWIEYGVRTYGDAAAEAAGIGSLLVDEKARPRLKLAAADSDEVKYILDQVRSGLEIAKVLRTVESATSIQDGAVVRHTKVVLHDVP